MQDSNLQLSDSKSVASTNFANEHQNPNPFKTLIHSPQVTLSPLKYLFGIISLEVSLMSQAAMNDSPGVIVSLSHSVLAKYLSLFVPAIFSSALKDI